MKCPNTLLSIVRSLILFFDIIQNLYTEQRYQPKGFLKTIGNIVMIN